MLALHGQSAASLGLEAIGQPEELGLEVVDGESLVVERPCLRQRIKRIIEAAAHAPGDIETPRGTDHAEYTLALSQAIELGDKRDKRVDVARLQLQDVGAQYDIARADALAQTATRFVECARAQAMVEWAQRRLSWAERSAKTATERARALKLFDRA